MSIYQVAIDGPVASGKGTVAKMLARKLGILCMDTGAIYRGVTVHFIDNEIDINDPISYNRALGDIDISVKCIEGATFVFLHGEDITARIRTNEVSVRVPQIAKLPEVRAKVLLVQQQVASGSSLVCEGRDIASVVFPNARFKFYLTASVRQRALRRFNELSNRGEKVTLEQLMQQIADRDHADMTREKSPLVCVPNAIKIDASRVDAYTVAKRMEKIITKSLSEVQ